MHLLSIAATLAAVAFHSVTSQSCLVRFSETSSGKGLQKTTFENMNYCEFRGVRYAESTAGDGRFQPPVLHPPDGEEDFTEEGNICPQLDDINFPSKVLGDEDCLFMNVYSSVADAGSTNLLPVLVFIHGGSFTVGSAAYDIAGVDLLIAQKVVVVSFNYRLDVLGFLRYPKFNISGNYGLKDQATALRWIHQYIQFFGGDPERITLVGHSAGAVSVNYHMYSQETRSLFQQAVLLSGNFLMPYTFSYDPEKYAEFYFGLMGISSREQLVSFDFHKLFLLNETSRQLGIVFASIQFPCFVPTAEDETHVGAYLIKSPHQLVLNEPVRDIPLLLGLTSTEFDLLLDYVTDYYWWDKNFPNRFNDTLTSYIETILHVTANQTEELGLAVDHNGFFRKIANYANVQFPVEEFIDQITSKGQSSPIFMYRFEFDGKFGWYKNEFYRNRLNHSGQGAIHGDDLGYIFTPFNVQQAIQQKDKFSKEWNVHRKMVQLVANFVKQGNPSTDVQSWDPHNRQKQQHQYLNIDEEIEMRFSEPRGFIERLWKSIHDCYYYFECSYL